MALAWGWLFLGARPDMYDIVGASVSLIGVVIIFYMPRKNEVMWKEDK
jgi:small multidrug resistance family-3 protein